MMFGRPKDQAPIRAVFTTLLVLGACSCEGTIAPLGGEDDPPLASATASGAAEDGGACGEGCVLGPSTGLPDAGVDEASNFGAAPDAASESDAGESEGGSRLDGGAADARPLPPPPDAGHADAEPQSDAGVAGADAETAGADAGRVDAGGVTGDSGADAGGAAGPSCREASTWPSAWIALEDEVLALVNRARAAGAVCGSQAFAPAPPLVMNAALREAARCHSLDLTTAPVFSHTGSDGSSPWDRIARAGYDGIAVSENIAAGQSTPDAVMASWLASAGHCASIMAPATKEIGVGYAFSNAAPYRHYWTQTFGTR